MVLISQSLRAVLSFSVMIGVSIASLCEPSKLGKLICATNCLKFSRGAWLELHVCGACSAHVCAVQHFLFRSILVVLFPYLDMFI